MSSGRSYPPMSLVVNEFRTPNQEFLLVSDLARTSNDSLESTATLQYGLVNYSVDELKKICLEHINGVMKFLRRPTENITDDTSIVLQKALEAVRQFEAENSNAKNVGTYLFEYVSKMLTVPIE
jgi:hypothetical protein